MPIIAPGLTNPLVDGRQSERALVIRGGVERYFEELGQTTLAELSLRNGRRADIVALCPKGRITIVEIKSSVADFQVDTKWPDYLEHCDQFFFATLADVPANIFPEDRGFIVADRFGCEIVRSAESSPLAPARRKDVHLRFARQAGQRLRRAELFGLDVPPD
ncbi:MAG: MmcB family DNA repair protein [Pseudomonadota bacterium]